MSCAPQLGEVVTEYVRPERAISRVFLHCSATSNKRTAVEDIHRWHLERGWSCIGYHYSISSDGVIWHGRDLELTPSAQAGHNTGTIAICLNGLTDLDFTSDQFKSLRRLAKEIWAAHDKKVTFHGHCEVSAKTCPVFDYKTVLNLDEAGRIKSFEVGGSLPKLQQATTPDDVLTLTVQRVPVSKTLNAGHSDVFVLQGLLTAFSIVHPGPCDGVFGDRTERSVKAFQSESDLVVDGVVGPVTWEALEGV